MADMMDTAREKAQGVLDFMEMSVKGVYYDTQAERLGLDPKSPNSVKEIEKRLKALQDLSVEDYMAVTAPPGTGGIGSLGVNAVKKRNQESALQNLLDHYTRKFTDTTKK